jgi:hypothetical protein
MNQSEFRNLRTGDRIHLKSRNGMYTFLKKDTKKGLIYITSKIWSYDDEPIRVTDYNDFKCLAGGLWRRR